MTTRIYVAGHRGKVGGAMRKLMDVSRLSDMGWCAQIGLEEGIRNTYDWFLEQDRWRSGPSRRRLAQSGHPTGPVRDAPENILVFREFGA